jgi:hypothetical protein
MRMQRTITPARYAWLIERLNLNQSAAGRFLGISDRQSRRFIAGDIRIDPATAMLLEIMVAHNLSPNDALRMIGGKRTR